MAKRIKIDCSYYKGDVPCAPHKKHGVHCWSCRHYEPIGKRILIIKLGAAGDVIRTTPILRKLKKAYPGSHITWLTDFPELVPAAVDQVLRFELKNVVALLGMKFNIIYNFDKDKEACALAGMIPAPVKKGFILNGNKCSPMNRAAEHKWMTGLFDDLNRANKKNYMEEMFEMAGFKFNKEKYILDRPLEKRHWDLGAKRPLIGLNTGCGGRWRTRLWEDAKWIALANMLKKAGYGVVLLGGPDEDEKNRRIAKSTGAKYMGTYPLKTFIKLVDQCDLVVACVTMALHIAIGLGKNIVLLNNIFNRNEFELYGHGKIIEPDVECKGCFKQACETDCMKYIKPEAVFKAIKELLPVRNK